MIIGAHVSISKGLAAAVKTAIAMEANTLQFFTRNPRGGKAKELDPRDISEARSLLAEHNFGPLVAHTPYTINVASAKPEVREFSIRTLKDDLNRIKQMGVPYLVFHVGTHGGQGEETGVNLVCEGLGEILTSIPEETFLLLEGMAGEGTELGYSLRQLGDIIAQCDGHPQLGICLDTCHLTGAGYDLTKLEEVKKEIDEEIGLDRVKVLHLNDSMFPLGSRRDRHAKLGEGYVGLNVIKELACDKDFTRIPLILETPNDHEGYAREIKLVKALCTGN
ncbi:MAG: Endonuclease [Peptococcaceae bacterium]|jgi:deoxyribonuclease-4|nr:Endonuclease [Peptococcaceae bacterium]